ncbi:MAG: hypothetical protein LLG37_10725 [Spirochaetia bacterium]|nr:hypothetical protein [Spirochaetia bacterium]
MGKVILKGSMVTPIKKITVKRGMNSPHTTVMLKFRMEFTTPDKIITVMAG